MSLADFDAIRPTVWLEDGNAMTRVPWLHCLTAGDGVGESINHASIKYAPAHYDGQSIIPEDHDLTAQHTGTTALAILNHNSTPLRAGQRIMITKDYDGNYVIFLGMLANREIGRAHV
jgi:hypothetical protein